MRWVSNQGRFCLSRVQDKIRFDQLVAKTVRDDLKSAERDELVKKHGYKATDYNR